MSLRPLSRREFLVAASTLSATVAYLAVRLENQSAGKIESERKLYGQLRGGLYRTPANFDKKVFYESAKYSDRVVFNWDIANGVFTAVPTVVAGHVVETSPIDESLSAVSSRTSDAIALIDWKSNSEIANYHFTNGHYTYAHCAFSAAGNRLLVSARELDSAKGKGFIYVFDVPTFKVSDVLEVPHGRSHELLALEGDRFLMGVGAPAGSPAFAIFDLKAKSFDRFPISEAAHLKGQVIHLRRRGDKVIGNLQTEGKDGTPDAGSVAVFDLATRTTSIKMPLGSVEIHSEMLSLELDPATNFVWFTLPLQNQLVVWDIKRDIPIQILNFPSGVTFLSLLPDAEVLLAGSGSRIYAYHSKTVDRLEGLERNWPHSKLKGRHCAHTRLV